MSGPVLDDRDERIRLLEFQVAFLHRELTFVTRRYHDMVYSAAWTLARPFKRLEDLAHRLVQSARRQAEPTRPQDMPRSAFRERNASTAEQIAARIARKMERPPAGP